MIITKEIKEILEEWNFVENIYFLPKIQLDRKMYKLVNDVLTSLWWKWNRWKKGHVFEWENLEEALKEVLEKWETETLKEYKKRTQFFETPKEVVKMILDYADIKKDDIVLEPSAWQGAIIEEIIKWWCENINVVELDWTNYDILYKKICNLSDNILASNCDFLEFRSQELLDAYDWQLEHMQFDKIVANPPFSKNQDVKHILHMYELLKEWWRIVSVASSSIQDKDTKYHKELLELNPDFIEIESWAFKESWTMVNTVLVIINKL